MALTPEVVMWLAVAKLLVNATIVIIYAGRKLWEEVTDGTH